MNKYIFIGLLSLLLPVLPAKAQTKVMGFMDGNFFDLDYSPTEPRYGCLMNGECYDYKTKETTNLKTILGLTDSPSVPQTITVTSGQMPTPTPTPTPTPVVTPTPIINSPAPTPTPMPESPIFNGSPYLVGYIDNWNTERTVNNKYAAIEVLLKREFSDLNGTNENFRMFCISPLSPNGSFLDYARRTKLPNGQYDGNKAIATVGQGPGNYSCKFIFKLPEGTFESESFEFSLE